MKYIEGQEDFLFLNSFGEAFNNKVYVFVGYVGLNKIGMMWVAGLSELWSRQERS